MYKIESEQLAVEIKTKGAELDRIFHKAQQLDYLWSGDAAIWGKKSPVLFPIVGTLKQDTYYYQGKPYKLGRHGFARDMEFKVKEQAPASCIFSLSSSEETLKVYPFSFEFDIIYTVISNRLEVTYAIKNNGNANMYFSVGAHPAFKVPLVHGAGYDDYYLQFNRAETKGRWPISPDGLIEKDPVLLLNNTSTLPLSKSLFLKDALVFKYLDSDKVSLRSHTDHHGLEFDFTGFPFHGLWAAKGADFLCIEPWCGIADSVDADQQLEHKEGIILLAAGDIFIRTWKVNFF